MVSAAVKIILHAKNKIAEFQTLDFHQKRNFFLLTLDSKNNLISFEENKKKPQKIINQKTNLKYFCLFLKEFLI